MHDPRSNVGVLLKVLLAASLAGPVSGAETHGSLRGRVFDASTGVGQPCQIELISVENPLFNTDYASCDAQGFFDFAAVVPGSYYLQAHGSPGYAFYLSGQGSCNPTGATSRCRLAQGAPVEVRGGEPTGPLEIPLEREASLGGIVTFDLTGGLTAVPSAVVRLFEDDGDEAGNWSESQPVVDFVFPHLAPGNYRLVVEGSPYWESFAWDGVPCGRWYCDRSSGQEIALAAGETRTGADFHLLEIPRFTGCTPSATRLCLNQGRYEIEATWKDFIGQSGPGVARLLTPDSGYFYFFTPDNLEIMVKALNGCDESLGHRFWIFAAGLTNVEVELRAKDTVTGAVRTYTNASGNVFLPILDVDAFATCDAPLPPALLAPQREEPEPPGEAATPFPAGPTGTTYCEPYSGSTSLCLAGRFRAEAFFRSPGSSGTAGSVPITSDTGAFYFFQQSNLEVVVKVLDACATELPGYWVFASGLTDVEVDLGVKDLATGKTITYRRGPGPYQPVIDLHSFPCD